MRRSASRLLQLTKFLEAETAVMTPALGWGRAARPAGPPHLGPRASYSSLIHRPPAQPGATGRLLPTRQMPGFQRLPCRVACSTSSSAAAFPPPNRNLTSSASSWWTSLKSREEEDSLDTRVAPEAPPSTGPTEAHKREMHAVNVAVAVNITIMIAKLGAWFVTSSGYGGKRGWSFCGQGLLIMPDEQERLGHTCVWALTGACSMRAWCCMS